MHHADINAHNALMKQSARDSYPSWMRPSTCMRRAPQSKHAVRVLAALAAIPSAARFVGI